MSLSLTSRPIVSGCNYNAAGNPIVYKFLSTSFAGLTNYRIEIELFRASNDTPLTNGVKFVYAPNSAGVTNVDVSAIVKTFISAEWSKPSVISEVDSQASIKFYIKYQELYDGSATSVVNDSANPIHAVYAALQIGSENGGNMLAYYPGNSSRLWLTKFALSTALQKMVIWRDWPFSLSFICPEGISLKRQVNQYSADGSLIDSSAETLASADSINRMLSPSLLPATRKIDVSMLGGAWVTQNSAADNAWHRIVFGNGLFVAVAWSGTGNRVMTSPDGINWTSQFTPLGNNNNWWGLTYGAGLYVAVAWSGTGNRVMTSPDGADWTLRTSAADNGWNSVTYGSGPGLFVAVADSGLGNRVMTSPDGINWTLRSSAADNQWYDVTYGNGLFVAVSINGGANNVMTSPDGVNWTLRSTPATSGLYAVTYGNGLFVAVGDTVGSANGFATSPDGINWTLRGSNLDCLFWGVAYGDGQFVAVGETTENRAAVSVDGINWSPQKAPVNNNWHSVAFGAGKFVAVASSGTGNRVMTLSDYAEFTSTVAIEVREVCDYKVDNDLLPGRNPIHLFWKNSLGGDSFWNFSKYHEYTYTYQNGKKAKRIILFESNLHPIQWEALQELNGTGEVFQHSIIELTSSINKTSQRVGQQVYMVSKDGLKKTGVIVIPSTDRVFARDTTNSISIEIELPEVFQL